MIAHCSIIEMSVTDNRARRLPEDHWKLFQRRMTATCQQKSTPPNTAREVLRSEWKKGRRADRKIFLNEPVTLSRSLEFEFLL